VFYCDAYRYFHYRIYEPLVDRVSEVMSCGRETPGVTPALVGRKVFLFQDGVERMPLPFAWTLNLDNGALEDVKLTGHPERTQNGPKSWRTHTYYSCGDYASATQRFYALHKQGGSGTWGSFTTIDPANGRCSIFAPAGLPPPSGANQPSPYGKFRIYERKNGTFMILFHTAGANLRVVRIA
jgi:hypothetical protein